MPDIVAETDRLILRTAEEADALRLHRHMNTPGVTAHLGGPSELHQCEERVAKIMASQARHGFGFLMMQEKETGEFAGYCGLKRLDAEGSANRGEFEIGWAVREDRWRRGYAREAVAAVFEWAFTRLDAPRILALTSEANRPSWTFMEALGMTRRKDLDFVDPAYPPEENPTKVYSMDRETWEKQR